MPTEITLPQADLERLLCRLAEVEGNAAGAIPEGWTLPPALEIDLANIVLDLLGAPADTWNWPASKDGYCRDWLSELWLNVVNGGMTPAEFISAVEGEKSAFREAVA